MATAAGRLTRVGTSRSRAGRSRLAAIGVVLACAALAGCGGDEDPAPELSEGGRLAARLPSDGALSITIADVEAVRDSLGMEPGTVPPTGSDEDDLTFLLMVGSGSAIVEQGVLPEPVLDAMLTDARAIASVAGDGDATAISTAGDLSAFEALLLDSGLVAEGEDAFSAESGEYAIATGDGLIAIADSVAAARSIVENPGDDVPDELGQLDGDGQLINLARFGSACVEATGTVDSVGEPGQVAFFTAVTPDPAAVDPAGGSSPEPRVEGDSVRTEVPAAKDPMDEPVARNALARLEVSYECPD